MGHLITAHIVDKKFKAGYRTRPIAHLQYRIGGGSHDIYELLGCTDLDGGASGVGEGRKISRDKIETALDTFCKLRLEGDDVFQELIFFSTILNEWGKAKSIYIDFG